MTSQEQFRALAKCACAKDLPRVLASGHLAIRNGDDPQYVLDCLLRNQPALFNFKAAKRQKESYSDNLLQTPKTEEERQEWARLKGMIEGGGAMDYWDQVAPIMQARLDKMQERWDSQIERQAAVVEESKALAKEVEAINQLQVTESPAELETETNEVS